MHMNELRTPGDMVAFRDIAVSMEAITCNMLHVGEGRLGFQALGRLGLLMLICANTISANNEQAKFRNNLDGRFDFIFPTCTIYSTLTLPGGNFCAAEKETGTSSEPILQ